MLLATQSTRPYGRCRGRLLPAKRAEAVDIWQLVRVSYLSPSGRGWQVGREQYLGASAARDEEVPVWVVDEVRLEPGVNLGVGATGKRSVVCREGLGVPASRHGGHRES